MALRGRNKGLLQAPKKAAGAIFSETDTLACQFQHLRCRPELQQRVFGVVRCPHLLSLSPRRHGCPCSYAPPVTINPDEIRDGILPRF